MVLRMVQACVILAGLTTGAAAQEFFSPSPTPPCTKTWTSVTVYERLDALPRDVIEAFAILFGENKRLSELSSWIAERDRLWGAVSIRTGYWPPDIPNLRFIFGLKNRDRWFVWYEYPGMIASEAAVVAFDRSSSRVTLVAHHKGKPEDLCAATIPLLDAKNTPGSASDKQ